MASRSKKQTKAIASSSASSSAIISLDKVCTTLDIPSSDVIHAFLLGSRLWGTSREDSDYDAYIVIKDTSSFATRLSSQKGFASIHSANVDGLVVLESNYQERIRESGVFDLVTLWLPGDYILKSTNLPTWKPDLQALRASVEKVLKRDLLMAQKHAENGKYDKVKKVLTQTIRMVMRATQIVQTSKVTDWNCANEVFSTMQFAYHLNSWEAFETEILPIQEAIWTAFREALSATLH